MENIQLKFFVGSQSVGYLKSCSTWVCGTLVPCFYFIEQCGLFQNSYNQIPIGVGVYRNGSPAKNVSR